MTFTKSRSTCRIHVPMLHVSLIYKLTNMLRCDALLGIAYTFDPIYRRNIFEQVQQVQS